MNKKNRHQFIRKIVLDYWIESQSQLLEYLENEGINATQATVSRDIKELGIVKIPEADGRIRYTILEDTQQTDNRLSEIFKDTVESVVQAQFLNVVKTYLGSANIVAAEIDELQWPEIVGTLAGTDTIVLISETEEAAKKINEQLSAYLD